MKFRTLDDESTTTTLQPLKDHDEHDPVVTVCVLTWNNARSLRIILDRLSAEREVFPISVLVVDQASTDLTQEVVKAEASWVKGLFFSRNVGISIARNSAARAATTPYVMFLDGDVVPVRGSVKGLTTWLINHSDVDAVGYWNEPLITKDREAREEEVYVLDTENMRDVTLAQPYPVHHYGVWRRERWLETPNPEFPPFNGPGWGFEDDVTALAALLNGRRIVELVNKSYLHLNSMGNSLSNLGRDEFHRTCNIRSLTRFSLIDNASPKDLLEYLSPHGPPSFPLSLKFIGPHELQEALSTILTDVLPFVSLRLLIDCEECDGELVWGNRAPTSSRFIWVGPTDESVVRLAPSCRWSTSRTFIFPRTHDDESELRNLGVPNLRKPCGDPLLVSTYIKLEERSSFGCDALTDERSAYAEGIVRVAERYAVPEAAKTESFIDLRRRARLAAEPWIRTVAISAIVKARRQA